MNAVVVRESRDTDVSVASQGVLGLVKFFDTPWDTNLFPEFLDTLIRTLQGCGSRTYGYWKVHGE